MWTTGIWKKWVFGPKEITGAVVVCPNCGHGMSIGGYHPFGSRHEIASDGSVNPSVICPGCHWHACICLNGWSTASMGVVL